MSRSFFGVIRKVTFAAAYIARRRFYQSGVFNAEQLASEYIGKKNTFLSQLHVCSKHFVLDLTKFHVFFLKKYVNYCSGFTEGGFGRTYFLFLFIVIFLLHVESLKTLQNTRKEPV